MAHVPQLCRAPDSGGIIYWLILKDEKFSMPSKFFMESGEYAVLKDLAIIVSSATVATWIFSYLKLPVLVGYIVVGILLSPILGLLNESEILSQAGEFGVMLMMFYVGMEFGFDRLKKVFLPSLFGVCALALVMGALGVAAARLMGMGLSDGIFLGGILSMSSTIIVVENLGMRGQLQKPFAQIAVGVLIFEDIYAVLLMVVLSGLAVQSESGMGRIFETIVLASTFVVAVFVGGKLAINMLAARLSISKEPQMLIMFAICIVLALGFLAKQFGLSFALGAFLAGSVISGSPVAGKVERLMSPFRNLFVAIFFVSVGTMIKPGLILDLWLPIILLSLFAVVFQIAACFTGAVIGGARAKDSFLAAVNMAQIGEFGFVIAGLGIGSGLIGDSVMAITMGVSFLTVSANPFLAERAPAVANFLSKRVPSAVRKTLKGYERELTKIKEASVRHESLHLAFRGISMAAIYAFLFNALVVTGAFISNAVVDSMQRQAHMWLLYTVWSIVGALALPLAVGCFRKVEGCVRSIAKASFQPRTFGNVVCKILSISGGGAAAAFCALVYFGVAHGYVGSDAMLGLNIVCGLLLGIVFYTPLRTFNISLESKFKLIFLRHLENADAYRHDRMIEKIKDRYSWAMDISEVELGDLSPAAGRTVAQTELRRLTGAEIVAVKRGFFVIYNIFPDTALYPGDVVVLCGEPSELKAAAETLAEKGRFSSADAVAENRLSDFSVSTLKVPEASGLTGINLRSANLTKLYAVKILGVGKSGEALRRPSPDDVFECGDMIVVMGDSEKISAFKRAFGLA